MQPTTTDFGMSTRRLCSAVLLALAASAAGAQEEPPPCPPAEAAAARTYAPTAAKLKAFANAYAAMVAAAAQDPGVAAVLNKQDRTGECTTDANETGMSFAGAQAMLTKHPRVGSIYAAQGISPRELVIWGKLAGVFFFASQPGALDDLSPAQQAFARDNKAGIERLTKVITSAMKQEQR